MIVILLAVATLYLFKINRLYFFGIAFFVIALFPVSQIFPVGLNLSAERYSYLSYIGLFIVLGHILVWLLRRFDGWMIPTAIGVLVTAFSVSTVRRIMVWENGATLWANVLETYPKNHYASYNLGHYWYTVGDTAQAMPALNYAIACKPDFAPPYITRAQIREAAGQRFEALEDYNTAITHEPGNAQSLLNRGLLEARMGQPTAALHDIDKALNLRPDYVLGHLNRGVVLEGINRIPEAEAEYSHAIKLDATNEQAYQFRGLLRHRSGRPQTAMEDYTQALALNHNNGRTHYLQSKAWFDLKEPDKAREALETALQLGYEVPDAAYKQRLGL